jgi:hypothetical protein
MAGLDINGNAPNWPPVASVDNCTCTNAARLLMSLWLRP